jgi:hypothetical protein
MFVNEGVIRWQYEPIAQALSLFGKREKCRHAELVPQLVL